MATVESPLGMMIVQQQDAEEAAKFLLQAASVLGTLTLLGPCGLYIIHYYRKAKHCPICGGKDWYDTTPSTHNITPYEYNQPDKEPKKKVVDKYRSLYLLGCLGVIFIFLTPILYTEYPNGAVVSFFAGLILVCIVLYKRYWKSGELKGID